MEEECNEVSKLLQKLERPITLEIDFDFYFTTRKIG